MITYEKKSSSEITVKIFKKVAGTIKTVIGGFQYFPKGAKIGSEIFENLKALKASLESDD